jgi:acyl-CoA synthetase (AMP-forming)/AMP-acid ligase II
VAGYVFVMAWTDDIMINVAECAVIGAADPLKGQLPVGLVVLKAGVQRSHEENVEAVVRTVREQIRAVAALNNTSPFTRSRPSASPPCSRPGECAYRPRLPCPTGEVVLARGRWR